MVESIKKYAARGLKAIIGGLLGGILLKLVLGISITTVVGICLFIVLANIILEEIEAESALKRFLTKFYQICVAVLLFLGVRFTVGMLVGMPMLSEAWNGLGNVGGLSGLLANGGQELALEVGFVIPCLGIVYLIKTSAKFRKFAYLLSVVVFGLMVYQIKQPRHAESVARLQQSAINLTEKQFNNTAMRNNAEAMMTIYVAVQDFTVMGNDGKDVVIKCGQRMRSLGKELNFAATEDTVKENPDAEPMIEVRLETTPRRFNGEKLTVPFLMLYESKAPIVPVDPTVHADGKPKLVWKTVFHGEYIGKGMGPKEYVKTAKAGQDYKIGDKLVVRGEFFQAYYGSGWTEHKGELVDPVTHSGSGYFGVKAPQGVSFIVEVLRLEKV